MGEVLGTVSDHIRTTGHVVVSYLVIIIQFRVSYTRVC